LDEFTLDICVTLGKFSCVGIHESGTASTPISLYKKNLKKLIKQNIYSYEFELDPHVNTSPSLESATTCFSPAETCTICFPFNPKQQKIMIIKELNNQDIPTTCVGPL
jgi:hypothetical protein